MSNILIIGASGLVGHHLFQQFDADRDAQLLGTYATDPEPPLAPLDIRDDAGIGRLFRSFCPDVVLLPAAEPNVDACEQEPERSAAINVEGTRNVALHAKEIGAKLVYFSTDYVFDGTLGPYDEEDPPSPISIYGRQKAEAERIVRETCPDHIVARVAVVYGWEKRGKNFVVRLVKSIGGGTAARIPGDQIGNPTYAPDLAAAIRDLVAADCRGTFHVVGKTLMDRATFAKLICKVFDLSGDLVVPIPTAELRQPAARPLNGGLKTDKLFRTIGRTLAGPKEGLRRMKMEGGYVLKTVGGRHDSQRSER